MGRSDKNTAMLSVMGKITMGVVLKAMREEPFVDGIQAIVPFIPRVDNGLRGHHQTCPENRRATTVYHMGSDHA
jgi:hypothetical protein